MYLQAIQRNLLRHLTGWQGGESIPDEVATAEEDETDVELLTRRQSFFSTLLGQFWNRWKREYVVDLREQHKSSQIVARENLEGLRRGILETTVSLEELLLKLLWAVARENVWEDPYKICLR